MTTVIMLQKKIVKALEQGRDTTPILKELAELRAKQAMDGELVELTKVAGQKKEYKTRAETIKAKVSKQDKAIDTMLEARNRLVEQLEPILEPMSELAKLGMSSWERDSEGSCYLFNDLSVYAAEVRSVPASYLKDAGCPFLSMSDGKSEARGKASEAYQYLGAAIAILKGFTKEIQRVVPGKADNPLVENEVETSCRVCQHPKVEAINQALAEGKSLRAIGDEFNVARSTLHRHKSNCLGHA